MKSKFVHPCHKYLSKSVKPDNSCPIKRSTSPDLQYQIIHDVGIAWQAYTTVKSSPAGQAYLPTLASVLLNGPHKLCLCNFENWTFNIFFKFSLTWNSIDLWAVGCFDSNTHVHWWVVGHVVSKQRFITDETVSCFVCRYEWYFVCKSYEIFLFSRSCCCWVVFNYQHSLLLGLCAW